MNSIFCVCVASEHRRRPVVQPYAILAVTSRLCARWNGQPCPTHIFELFLADLQCNSFDDDYAMRRTRLLKVRSNGFGAKCERLTRRRPCKAKFGQPLSLFSLPPFPERTINYLVSCFLDGSCICSEIK